MFASLILSLVVGGRACVCLVACLVAWLLAGLQRCLVFLVVRRPVCLCGCLFGVHCLCGGLFVCAFVSVGLSFGHLSVDMVGCLAI